MNPHLKSTVCALALALVPAACGNSPLLHHLDADDVKNAPQANAQNGCDFDFPKANLCASLAWVTKPTDEDEGSFTLSFWNKSTGSLSGPFAAPGADVAVKLWMPSMGHGSSPIKVEPTGTPGVYSATNVYFIMPGAWEIDVDLKTNGTVSEEAVMKIQI